jgi:hypothetical protein
MAENNSSAPLLPCPFCGAAARMKPSTRGDYTSIVCNSPCAGPLAIVVPNDQIEAGIAAWNTRAPQAVAAQAPTAVAVPDGWKLVPMEPQDMQQAAGVHAIRFDTTLINKMWTANKVYREMVASAPECAALAATPALPTTEDSSAGDLAGWAIDVSAGREILVYKNCSVIEAEQAHLVLSLIRQAEVQAEPVAPGTRLGRAEVRAGKVGYFAFEQTDLDDGDYFLYTAPQAQPADALDAEIAKLKKAYQELGNMFHDQIVAQQAAWIEWQHGAGAEAGMQWIENGLCGPGHIPDEDEPYGTEAQAYFDANKSDPFPACYCGRPSNILWMGKGFCSDSHHDEHRAAMAAAQEGGNA